MAKQKETTETLPEANSIKKTCGIVMPISDSNGYPQNHWDDVLQIIKKSIELSGFKSQLVSDDPAIGLIHERIVTNLYNNEIVVCDVSSKNPNVMFELGMRLAFDKPTVIIKDSETSYSFDTGGIEHLEYPVSLRHKTIELFIQKLSEKIVATYDKSTQKDYSPFLKSFGNYIVPATIDRQEITEVSYIISELDVIKRLIARQQKLITSKLYQGSFDQSINNPSDIDNKKGLRAQTIFDLLEEKENKYPISFREMLDSDINGRIR